MTGLISEQIKRRGSYGKNLKKMQLETTSLSMIGRSIIMSFNRSSFRYAVVCTPIFLPLVDPLLHCRTIKFCKAFVFVRNLYLYLFQYLLVFVWEIKRWDAFAVTSCPPSGSIVRLCQCDQSSASHWLTLPILNGSPKTNQFLLLRKSWH